MLTPKMVLQVQMKEDNYCKLIQSTEGTSVILNNSQQQVEIPSQQWHQLIEQIQLIVKLHKVLNQTYMLQTTIRQDLPEDERYQVHRLLHTELSWTLVASRRVSLQQSLSSNLSLC